MIVPTPPTPPEGSPRPRKVPQQARSQITVDAILEAAAQKLVADGYDGLAMVEVAERAGVSVGSLYQYYPDKAALVAGVIEAHLSTEARVLARAHQAAVDAPIADAVDTIADAIVAIHADDPGRSAAILVAAGNVTWGEGIASLTGQVAESLAAFLDERASEVHVADADLAAYVVATSVRSLVHWAVLQRPEAVETGAVAREARDLVRRYLLCGDLAEGT